MKKIVFKKLGFPLSGLMRESFEKHNFFKKTLNVLSHRETTILLLLLVHTDTDIST